MTTASTCYHCGEALPAGRPIYAEVGNANQLMCCLGCKAVAEFIHDSGLNAFYKHRSQPQAELGLRAQVQDWSIYDDSELLDRYVSTDGSTATATIDIGGMYCSACVWLLDNALSRYSEIHTVSINAAQHRAVIQWDADELNLSQLLAAINEIGFKPSPTAAGLGSNQGEFEQRSALRRLIVAAAAGMQVMMFAVALYAGEHYGIEGRIEQFLRLISLLVTIPIVFYSARPFFIGAWRGLRARAPGMDLPVAIAIAAAFFASVRAVLAGDGAVYFDSVAMFVLFLSATRYLEMRVRHRSEDFTQALAGLLPDAVIRIVNGEPEVITPDQLRISDIVMIRPGDVIPADGIIVSGELAIDEALLTGEPMPVPRSANMDVYAGGTNRSGTATVQVSRVGANTSLAEISRLLERAKADRPKIAQLADQISSKFVISVLVICAATLLIWLNIDPSRAFAVVLATLVVTCPCALSLATPAAMASATTRLAKDGFLLVRSRVLGVLSTQATIVFDKTGTLTAGKPEVRQTTVIDNIDSLSEDDYLRIAASIETASEHVLARAFNRYYEAGRHSIDSVRSQAGAGVEALVDGIHYKIGNAEYVSQSNDTTLTVAGDSIQVFLSTRNRIVARFEIADELRVDAELAIKQLHSMGYRLIIASGDRDAAVSAVAKRLNIAEWHSSLNPAGKLDLIHELQKAGTAVVMVGDGINDTPVLAAADASIAIDAGTALARASADAVVMGKRLCSIVDGANVARKTRKIIRQNISWAIVYNLTAVPLAASGLLSPWMAAAGMSLSSLVVVVNALRIQRADQALSTRADSVNRKQEKELVA